MNLYHEEQALGVEASIVNKTCLTSIYWTIWTLFYLCFRVFFLWLYTSLNITDWNILDLIGARWAKFRGVLYPSLTTGTLSSSLRG